MSADDQRVETLDTGRCRAEVSLRAPGVLATRVVGHANLAVARFYVARAQREMLTERHLRVFHDWSGLTGYDPEAREALRDFATKNDDTRVRVYLLIRSKIVSMAIQTASLVMRRDFQATSDAAVFEQWLREALRERPGKTG
jgi:hypothetical protein